MEKACIKRVKNIDLLHELPFYDELSVVEISQAFKRYTRNYKIEKIDSKDPLAQLEASKSSIEDFFKDLLDEMLYRIDNWINEGSGWVIESADLKYWIFLILVHSQEDIHWITLVKKFGERSD